LPPIPIKFIGVVEQGTKKVAIFSDGKLDMSIVRMEGGCQPCRRVVWDLVKWAADNMIPLT